ncbi:MAG: hypothetical protein ABIH41_04935 [Nanoarchaeota archaeon]
MHLFYVWFAKNNDNTAKLYIMRGREKDFVGWLVELESGRKGWTVGPKLPEMTSIERPYGLMTTVGFLTVTRHHQHDGVTSIDFDDVVEEAIGLLAGWLGKHPDRDAGKS